MLKKKIMILAILFVSLLAVSTVSATDNVTSDVVSVEEMTDDVISVENDNQISGSVDYGIDYLSVGADGSFTDLANEITNANGELNLTRDYVFSTAESKYIDGIVINKQITIDGKGFSINGNNNARAFEVSSGNVILKNINFIDCVSSSSGGAIYWKGASGKLINCSFTDCHSSISNSQDPKTVYNPSCSLTASGSSYGGAIYWIGNSGSISECDFKNCYCSATNYVHATANSRDWSKDPFRGTSSTTSSTTESSSYGGAIYWGGTSGRISDCNFINCYSKSYGASYSSSTFTHYIEMGNTYGTKEYSAYCDSYSSCSSYSSIYWVGSNGNLINSNFKNPTPSYGSDSESNKDSRSYVKATSESSSSTYGGAIYWGGTSGRISDCNFITSASSSYYKDAVYWKGNGNQFNCSFNGNYYDYSKYCGKYQASVYPIMSIHKSTLDDDGRIVIFESTQLVKNITVTLYDITDTKILYDQFDISSEDLTSSLNLNNLKEGKYQIELQYAGDAFYSATSTNAQFNIGKNSSFEVLIPENIVEGDATTINLTLNGDASGKVKLILSNYTFINELIEGKTSFNIPAVSGGINTFQIKYIGDNKYNPIYINDTFNVLFKSDINLDLEDKYIFGENIPLTYIITPNCTGIIRIYIDNVFKSNITVNDVFELKNINAGNHNVTFIYSGDENFSSSSTYSLLTVLKADPTIKVNSSNLPGTLSFDIILNETATGNISINFDNKIYSGSIINGKTNIIVPNVNAGDYSVNVNYTGDNNYNTKSYDIQLTINKISTSVSGTIDNIIYSQEAIVNVKGTVDGVAVVKIDENFIENINIIANTITPVTFEGLSAGKHNVTITLKPSNTNYEESTYNTDFTINKKDTTVKLGVENSIYGKEVIVNVTASNDGKVIVTIGDITKEKNVFANILTKINMGVLAADSYEVVASFDAGNNYKSSSDNDNIVISPAEAQIIEIQTTNNTYGEKTIIKVKTDVAGTLNIKVESTEKSFYVNANKLTSLDLGILDAGLQNVEIILDAGRNYTKPEKNTQVNIAPKSTTVNVNVENYIYGENVVVGVTASENGRISVKLGDIVKYVDVTANKIFLVDFGIVDAKSYAVNVAFNAGNNYEESYNNAALTVSPAQSKITEIDAQNNVYSEKTIIKVKTNVDGALTVKLGTNTKLINVIANQLASVDFGILDANDYDISLNLNAGSNYISSSNSTKITVLPKSVSLNCEVTDSIYGNDVVVKVTASENGKITVKLGEIVKYLDVDANRLTSVNFGILNVGNYKVDVSFDAGSNYVSTQKSSSIKVTPKNTVLTLNVKDYEVNEHIIINVTASENGKATVKIGDIVKNVDVMANKPVSIDFGVLNNGSYEVVANFAIENNYLNSSDSAIIKVLAKIDEKDIDISVPEIKPNQENNIVINLPADATGTVTLIIGNNSYNFDVKNGVANVNVPKLDAGNYDYVINYSGDNKYSSFENSGHIDVEKPTPEIVVPPLDEPSEDGSVAISLPGDATGTVTLTINGKEYYFAVVKGAANIIIPDLGDGNYPYTITYSGDSKYSSFTTNGTLNKVAPAIDPVITASNVKVTYANGKYYTIKVYGTDGELADGVKVVITVKGKTFKTLTTSNGVARFKVTNVPGTYKMNITALGKSVVKTLTVKHLVTLKSVTVKKSAKKLTLQATLGKVNGKYLKNKKITFKFNGKKYTAKTDKKGVAKVTIKSSILKKLKVGKKVTYQATYSKDTVKKTVKIKK